MSSKRCIIPGIILVVLGLLIAIGGPLLSGTITNYGLHTGMADFLVVDSTSAPFYKDWAGNIEETNPYYEIYYMWNCTNAANVTTKGDKPVYVQTGPYTYQRHRTNVNVSFINDGEESVYSILRDYVFMPSMSNGSESDHIVNLNPAYIGIIAQAGNEVNGQVAAAGPALAGIANFFANDFKTLYVASLIPSSLQSIVETQLIPSINETFKDSALSWAYFYSHWANSSFTPAIGNASYWSGVFIPGNLSFSDSSIYKLWDSNQTNSLLDQNENATWLWYLADHHNDANASATLQGQFGLDAAQWAALSVWRTRVFATSRVEPQLVQLYNLDNINDIGFLQWASAPLFGSAGNPESVFQIWPQLGYGGNPIELPFVSNTDPGFFTPQQARQLLVGQTNMSDILTYQAFLMAKSGGSTNFTAWALNSSQADTFFNYGFGLSYLFVRDHITAGFAEGNGLFANRAVGEWLWTCTDPWLALVSPGKSCALQQNHTYNAPHTVHTGKGELNKINKYVKWRNMTEVVGVWNGTLPVTGHTESGQFRPFLNDGDAIASFDPDLVRATPMHHVQNITIKDINVFRYQLDDSNWAASDFFYTQIPGTFNMTSSFQGIPVFLTAWDLLHVANGSQMVVGMNATTEELCGTNIDVEPTTGMTLQAQKRLQVNLYIPSSAQWFASSEGFDNQAMYRGSLFPLLKVEEYVTLSDETADMIKSKLEVVPKLHEGLFYGSLAVGPVLVIIGGFLVVLGVKRARRGHYRQIN